MMFFTLLIGFKPRCTVCEMIFDDTPTLTLPTPGSTRRAASTDLRIRSIWLLAG
ncbi:hypothetical protein D3C85_708440 [compost metagenome]